MPESLVLAFSTPGLGWLFLAAFVAGTVRGFSGFGTALVYLPVASIFLNPFHAIATVVAMDLLGPVPNLRSAWAAADRPDLARLVSGIAIGLPIGLGLLSVAPPELFRIVVSLIALGMVGALLTGFRLSRRPGPAGTVGVGAAGGAMGGFAGVPGPPVILTYLAGPSSAQAVRANTMLYLYAYDLFALTVLWVTGLMPPGVFVAGLLIGIPNMAGNIVGGRIFMPGRERVYRGAAYAIIAASALLGLPVLG